MILSVNKSRKKLYFIFIIISPIFVIYSFFYTSINSFKRPVIVWFQGLNYSMNSSPVLQLITQMSDNSSENKYLVNTEKCKIIDWPLFDSETRPLFHNNSGKTIKCSASQTTPVSVRRVNQTFIEIKYLSYSQPIPQCFATELIRKRGNDSKVFFGETFGPIIGSAQIPNSDAVVVKCYERGKSMEFEFSKFDAFPKIKVFEKIVPLIPVKRLKTNSFKTIEQNIPNVLMLGIDSISWLQFKRQFSLTKGLAEKYEFYPMYGYNKVGDNTFPNLMAVLTGQFFDYYWNESISKTKYFDDVPFIWKEFSKQNFITTLIEDLPRYSLFNFNKIGFYNQPTDYYLRPVSLSINDQVNNDCYRDQMELQFYYDYTYDLLNAMKIRKQKYFSFVFMAHLTHNTANNAGYADLPLHRLLTKLFDNNLMDDTILFLFSDHGIRFGDLRNTFSGTIEERLPFVYLYLPKNYKTSEIDKNLFINSHRLTTPFDIHATLLHIAKGKSIPHLSHGKSLFEEIPDNRSCDSEQISQHWCVCSQYHRIGSHSVRPMAQFIVSQLNQLLRPESKLCVKLTLHKILTAFVKTDGKQKFYLIRIIVKPSLAMFESTVTMESNKMIIIGDISRNNEYREQSVCIDNTFLKKYCFCK